MQLQTSNWRIPEMMYYEMYDEVEAMVGAERWEVISGEVHCSWFPWEDLFEMYESVDYVNAIDHWRAAMDIDVEKISAFFEAIGGELAWIANYYTDDEIGYILY